MATVTVSGLLAALVLLHFGVIGAGQWGADEYFHFGMLRQFGLAYLLPRLVHWSARPFSEALIYAYYWLMEVTGRPLIAPVLAGCWAVLVGAIFAQSFRTDRRATAPRLLLGLALLSAFLLGHPVAEMFYWPMGAAAYLPSLAAITYVAFALLDGQLSEPAGRGASAAMLTLAAGSSELGALFVAGFVPLLLLPERLRRRTARVPLAWALFPLGLALLVIGLSAFGRAGSPLEPMAATPTLGHFWPSMGAAFAQVARELLGFNGGASGWRFVPLRPLAGLLLLLGFRWCLRRGEFGPAENWQLLALIVALLGACAASLAASNDIFGVACCERHDTFRQCSYVLMLLMLAGLGLPDRPARVGAAQALGPAALLLALLILFQGRWEQLRLSYSMYSATREARVTTWQSAAEPGPELQFRDAAGPLTRHIAWPAGLYRDQPGAPWQLRGVAIFFNKPVVRFR